MKTVLIAALSALILSIQPVVAQTIGVTADTITIGAHGPITGPAAYIGLAGRDGMLLAVKEINASGGINGRKIAVAFEDDGHSPTKALAAAKKLVEQDNVFMMMSVGGSNATIGAVDYMKTRNLVYYVSIASAPQVTWPFSRTMFRGGTSESARYGELYAEYLVTHYKAKRIAIISGREEYPRNEGDATVEKLKNWFQTTPAIRVEFNIGDKDFTPQLVDVQKTNPDVIAFFGNPAEAAIAMRQAKEFGLKQPFFVGGNMVDPALVAVAKSVAEGVMGFSLIPLLPGSRLSDMVKWEAAWKKEYPNAPAGRPNNFDLIAYADMYVVAEGLKRSGSNLNTDNLIISLESIQNYRVGAVATPRSFAKNHHVGNLTLVPMVVKDGQWEPVVWSSSRESDILKRYR